MKLSTKNITNIFTIIMMLIVFWVGNKISYQIRTTWDNSQNWQTVSDQALNDFLYPFHISLHLTDITISIICTIGVALTWLYHYAGKTDRRFGEEHGSAKWGTAKDFRPFSTKKLNQCLKITNEHQLNINTHTTQRNLNLLCIGGSGAGKSRNLVKPNIYTLSTSFIITDPKGELLRDCGQYLKDNGYKIRCLNLIDFNASDKFNPLSYFNPDQVEVSASILTQNFITNTTGSKPSNVDSFWEKAEKALLNALITYEYAINSTDGTLNNVTDMLGKMQAWENDETARSEIDLIFETIKELIDESENHEWGSQALQTLNQLKFAYSQYNTYMQGAGETKKSVTISLGVRLAPLHMTQIRNILATDTISLNTIGKEKTAVFMIIPDTHSTFTFLTSIFYELFFETNIYQADHLPQGHLPIPIQCLMDEFANIGKMPSFEKKIAVMRSRWISTMIIIQNYTQGKSLYKDDWETIVGNCDNFLFLGGNEKSTTEYVSKILGKQTIQTTDTSQTRGRNGSYSKSEKHTGRDLLTPDEVARLDTKKCIYILRGIKPFIATKTTPPPAGKPFTYHQQDNH